MRDSWRNTSYRCLLRFKRCKKTLQFSQLNNLKVFYFLYFSWRWKGKKMWMKLIKELIKIFLINFLPRLDLLHSDKFSGQITQNINFIIPHLSSRISSKKMQNKRKRKKSKRKWINFLRLLKIVAKAAHLCLQRTPFSSEDLGVI